MSHDNEILGQKSEEPLMVVPDKIRGNMGQALLLALAMGGEETRAKVAEIVAPTSRPRTERDPRFHRLEKISPNEYFISVGPGEIEGKYYATIMAPSKDPESPTGYDIIAICRYGFDTELGAKVDAAKQFPSLPVLGGTDSYSYPYYNQHKLQVILKAQELRDRKAAKRQTNWDKQQKSKTLISGD